MLSVLIILRPRSWAYCLHRAFRLVSTSKLKQETVTKNSVDCDTSQWQGYTCTVTHFCPLNSFAGPGRSRAAIQNLCSAAHDSATVIVVACCTCTLHRRRARHPMHHHLQSTYSQPFSGGSLFRHRRLTVALPEHTQPAPTRCFHKRKLAMRSWWRHDWY